MFYSFKNNLAFSLQIPVYPPSKEMTMQPVLGIQRWALSNERSCETANEHVSFPVYEYTVIKGTWQ